MARRIELKSVAANGAGGPNGGDPSASFSYGAMIQALLRYGPPGGLNFEDVVRSVAALAPVEQAIAEAASEVTLSDEQWRTLKTKLEQFPFAVADQVIVDFGMMIRNAPEIGTGQQPERP
jgi:hypothetical protein